MLALAVSCTLNPKDNPANPSNPGTSALDSNTIEFINNFQKQKLYTTGNPQEKDKVTINPNTADITIPATATMSSFGGDLTFIRSLSPTKAVYHATNNMYWLLEYDPTGSGAHPAFIKASAPSATDNFNNTTQTGDNNGALYK